MTSGNRVGTWGRGALATVLGLALCAGPGARAAVTPTGDTTVGTTSAEDSFVGRSATGTLLIDAGSKLNGRGGFIGDAAGATGSVRVTGTGSTWVSSYLFVGDFGNGTLAIDGGGRATSTRSLLGYGTGSTGTVTVTGPGSLWDSGQLTVGDSGAGSLLIESGGRVTSNTTAPFGTSRVGDGADGSVTITGSGSEWAVNSSLLIGTNGRGMLTIADGGRASTATTHMGGALTAIGAATVTGAGAVWANSGPLYLGDAGKGTLTVSDGGRVATGTLLGTTADLFGNGTITAGGAVLDDPVVIDGDRGTAQVFPFGTGGSLTLTLDGTGDLGAGYRKDATLRIIHGAVARSMNGYVGNYLLAKTAVGTATVSGAGSTWIVSQTLSVGAATVTAPSTLTVEAGGRLDSRDAEIRHGRVTVTGAGSSWSNSNALTVDGTVASAISVEAGGQFNSNIAYVGKTGYGAATVTGAGSTWTNAGSLYLAQGNYGSGSLRVEAGGQLRTQSAYLAYATGRTATAAVTGPGSKWAADGSLYVGYSGSALLTVEAGGEVTCRDGWVAAERVDSSTATVTGAGSRWTSSATLNVGDTAAGYAGKGTLNILDGGQVSAVDGYVGRNGHQGTVYIEGAGSEWNNSDTFTAGTGYATVTIASGGRLTAPVSYLGAGGFGAATVGGAGSRWTGDSLYVGYGGTGSLLLWRGGLVADRDGYVGYNTTKACTARVSGAGSAWTNSGTLRVGDTVASASTLSVGDRARVTAVALSVKSQAGVHLFVTGDDMIVLGDATTPGSVVNDGALGAYAGALLPPGVYRPITESAGRPLSWSGSGAFTALGGTWDADARTLAVAAALQLAAGSPGTPTAGGRLLFTDTPTGRRAGVGFGSAPAGTTLTATVIPDSKLASTLMKTGWGLQGKRLYGGWNFDSDAPAGTDAVLTIDIGPDAGDVALWQLVNGTWTSSTAPFAHEADGPVNFKVQAFGSYAVTEVVPEPAAPALLALALPRALRRRRCPRPRPATR